MLMKAITSSCRTMMPKVLLVAVVVALLKFGVHYFQWDIVKSQSLYSLLLTSVIFVMAFLMAGTFQDFNESERLPVELAGAFRALGDDCLSAIETDRRAAGFVGLVRVQKLLRDVLTWLYDPKTATVESLDYSVGCCYRFLVAALVPGRERMENGIYGGLRVSHLSIRQTILRIDMIRRTDFVSAGYFLAILGSVIACGSLLFLRTESVVIDFALPILVAIVLSYLILLIADLDNPFNYEGGRPGSGSAEVDIEVLEIVNRALLVGLARWEDNEQQLTGWEKVPPPPEVIPGGARRGREGNRGRHARR